MLESEHPDPSSTLATARREFGWWGAFWGWLFGTFLLFATITNLLHGLFDFQLLPVFQNTLTDFRVFMHWALDTFLFSWVTAGLSYAFYAATALLSYMFADITPWLPHIVVAAWYKDLVLVSAVAQRAQLRAFRMSRVFEAARSSEKNEDSQWVPRRIWRIEIWAIYVASSVASLIWVVERMVRRATGWPVTRLLNSSSIGRFVGDAAVVAFSGISMAGLVLLVTGTVLALVASDLPGEGGRVRRSRTKWLWFTLTMAVLSSAAFFVWNGYALK